jgi:hypothetical protein
MGASGSATAIDDLDMQFSSGYLLRAGLGYEHYWEKFNLRVGAAYNYFSHGQATLSPANLFPGAASPSSTSRSAINGHLELGLLL